MRESLGFLMKIITLLGLLMLLFFGSPATSAQSWMQIPITTNRWSSMACSADARKLFACAGGGQPFTAITPCLVYFSTNSGSTWLESGAPSNHWSSIASSADGNKVIAAVGSSSRSGGIYTSIDGGQNWASNNIPARQWRSVTSSADGSKLYALTFNGELYSTSDSGMTWHSNSAPQRAWTIASSADGTKLIAAPGSSGGYLCTSSDSGATWLTNTSISPRVWWTVASSADGRVLAAVDGNGGPFGKVFTSTNYGVVWVTNALPIRRRSRARVKRGSAFIGSSAGTRPAAAVIAARRARGMPRNGRTTTTSPAATSRRIAASPNTPEPRWRRIRKVSAWSSRWWASRRWLAPTFRVAASRRRYRAARAAA